MSDIFNSTMPAGPIPGPSLASGYEVTSLTPVHNDNTKLLITVYGEGLFVFDTNDPTPAGWTSKITNNTLAATEVFNPGSSIPVTTAQIPNFVSLKMLKDAAGIPNGGYLLFTDNVHYKVSGTNYFTGVFYCDDDGTANFLPDGSWTSLHTLSTDDYGWNRAARPCANMNSALLVPYNQPSANTLLIGKSGSMFVTAAPVAGTAVNWQQIYTENNGTSVCGNADAYYNIGFVNTSSKCILPDPFVPAGSERLWVGEFDRSLWVTDQDDDFTQIKNNTTNYCISLNDPLLPACSASGAASFNDCSFITRNTYVSSDNNLYAGISEGFGQSKG